MSAQPRRQQSGIAVRGSPYPFGGPSSRLESEADIPRKSAKNADEKGYGAIGEHQNVWLVPRPEQPAS